MHYAQKSKTAKFAFLARLTVGIGKHTNFQKDIGQAIS
jgi:hypothetical protein